MNKQRKVLITITYNEMGIIIDTKAEEVAQPNLQPTCSQLATDTISRQAAILDVTCGSRTIWFQKSEPHTTYCDIRKEEWEGDFGKTLKANGKKKHRHLVIDPDILCSFTDLPFEEESFNLVVFDPPHIEHLKQNAWMRKSYGTLDGDWKPMIKKGFEECMRVLKNRGVLIFKWSDISISTREIINVIGQEPLFGHRSGKKMNTHWMCYMKFNGGVNE